MNWGNQGGMDIRLVGRPDRTVHHLQPPAELFVPLRSRRLAFDSVTVTQGQRVQAGAVLAHDRKHYGLGLPAPCGGRAEYRPDLGCIRLRDLIESEPAMPRSASRSRIETLLWSGAWRFVRDAFDGSLPDPARAPKGVIVSTVRREPFLARGDALLHDRVEAFVTGVSRLQSLLTYQPIYMVLPNVKSPLADRLRAEVKDRSHLYLVTVPMRYGRDNPAVVARQAGYRYSRGDRVWYMFADGVLAISQALTGVAATRQVVSLGGPGAVERTHFDLPIGYPLQPFLEARIDADHPTRAIRGGALTGEAITPDDRGVDCECAGLTVLHEAPPRRLLPWARPGAAVQSWSRCFFGAFRRHSRACGETAVHGERRPCVACGYCEQVCPAGIRPHILHRLLHADDPDAAEALGLQLCVECGLCSYVCPSKLELREQFSDAKTNPAATHPGMEGGI